MVIYIQSVTILWFWKHTIVDWVKILNNDFRAAVSNCGFLLEQFIIQRGCRQGDPIASYLLIICAEILTILIKQNDDIGGIIINGNEHKLSMYALVLS